MLGEHVVALEVVRTKKVWEFPPNRFVQWGPEDESFCRAADYGREVVMEETIRIPRALITEVHDGGHTIEFVALPDVAPAFIPGRVG